MLDDTAMHLLYNNWINPKKSYQKNQSHGANYYSAIFKDVLFFVSLFATITPSKINVLDFRMGWASWAKVPMAHGFNVYGHELSPERNEYAKSLGIIVMDDLEKSGVLYDYINTEQVFEYLTDPKKVLQLLSTKAKPGGVLRLSVPLPRKDRHN